MLKGHLDMIVLAALSSGPAHGYAVIQEIQRRSGGAFELPEGTIYPALHRLEQSGLLSIQVMPQRAPVADYLGALTRELSFDVPLAHRVRQEVEDHLWEATAVNGDTSIEAQARAVRRFGEAREIASQYAALSLLRQTRRSGAIIVLTSGALYIAMRGRAAWYGLMQWALSDTLQPVGKVALAIDRTAYILAFLIGAVGWAYISSRRVSRRFHAGCRAQLKRGLLLAMAAACPMVVSVIADAVVTALRLLDERPPVSVFLIPLLSIAIEVAFAAVLVIAIGKTLRNALRASSLLSS